MEKLLVLCEVYNGEAIVEKYVIPIDDAKQEIYELIMENIEDINGYDDYFKENPCAKPSEFAEDKRDDIIEELLNGYRYEMLDKRYYQTIEYREKEPK